jgi:hypothetical protein
MKRVVFSPHMGLAVLLWVPLAAGCGSRTPLAPVAGKVTLDGQPVTGGQVTLVSVGDAAKVDPKGSLSAGQIDSGGQYKIFTGGKEGAPLGQYKVTVTPSMVPAPDATKAPTVPFNAKFMNVRDTPLTVEVVDNPAPGRYDLKLTR